MVLNKIFNEKCVEQLAWRGYEEYIRVILEKQNNVVCFLPSFKELDDNSREAWISATDRILELAIWEVKHKLEK